MTLTTDRLETIASWRDKYGTGHNVMLPAEEAEAMARELLANREAQPVAWQYRYSSLGLVGEWKTVQDELLCNMRPEYERRPIFTAPPLPAAPENTASHGLHQEQPSP